MDQGACCAHKGVCAAVCAVHTKGECAAVRAVHTRPITSPTLTSCSTFVELDRSSVAPFSSALVYMYVHIYLVCSDGMNKKWL